MKNYPILFLIVNFAFTLGERFSSRVDDVQCERQLKYFSESLSKRESWALDLFDSWTKFQSGVSHGNAFDFGNFDQCLGFRHEASDKSVGVIQGQHCLVYYRATANATTEPSDGTFDWSEIGSALRARNLRLGGSVCLPSTCSATRIQSFVSEFLAPADLQVTNDYNQSDWCLTSESQPLSSLDIVCIVVLSILALMLILSTAYELTMIRANLEPHELYSAFSVYKNGSKLFDVSRKGQSNMLDCLSGLRTLAMLHIMLGHRYSWIRSFPNVNSSYFAVDGGEWPRTLFSAFVAVQPIAVDSFFVMGGLLLARSILHSIEKGKFNIAKMYLHRYLRTIPVLGILILIVLSILKHLGDGPYYDFVSKASFVGSCERNWWAAFLHIQNYYCPIDSCLQVSWYLSVDFQLVLISPIILYPIYKWGWKILWLIPTYIVGIEIYIFVLTLQSEIKAVSALMSFELRVKSAERLYFPTHIRCGPWLIGVMLGYIFHQTKGRKVVINKTVNAVLWILSISTITAILVGMLPMQNVEKPASNVANALWLALTRNNWGYSIAWIIFACCNGSGGVIKWFLELPCWQPLGRMSLSFYLVHTVYQTVHTASRKVPMHFSDRDALHHCLADFVASTFLAMLLYLTLEEPVLLIENYIYKQIAMKKERKNSN